MSQSRDVQGAHHAAARAVRRVRRKALLRGALTAVFGVSGVIHLAAPAVYRPIMPPWLPAPDALIAISGVCELLGALGLLAPGGGPTLLRRVTRYGLVALLFAVFPANVQMALNGFDQGASPLVLTLEVARLPLQAALVLLVLAATSTEAYPAQTPSPVTAE